VALSLPLQIKDDARLVLRGEPAPVELQGAALRLDGRLLPVEAPAGAPLAEIARELARVPRALREVLTRLVVSAAENPSDAEWSARYGLPVRAGMGANASGTVTIFPHGLSRLTSPDRDAFARNLLHELGHCWSLRAWRDEPAAQRAWLAAMARDPAAPSVYAQESFRRSGLPFEDAAEATALYFLVRETEALAEYRAALPARFALLDERFHER
jgi:hypothetical protein